MWDHRVSKWQSWNLIQCQPNSKYCSLSSTLFCFRDLPRLPTSPPLQRPKSLNKAQSHISPLAPSLRECTVLTEIYILPLPTLDSSYEAMSFLSLTLGGNSQVQMGGKSIPGGGTSACKFAVAREIYLDEADLGMLSEMEEQKVLEIKRKNWWWQDGIEASIDASIFKPSKRKWRRPWYSKRTEKLRQLEWGMGNTGGKLFAEM